MIVVLDVEKIWSESQNQWALFFWITLTYKITLASSRSGKLKLLMRREIHGSYLQKCYFCEDGSVQKDLLEDDLVLPFERVLYLMADVLHFIFAKSLTPEEEVVAYRATGRCDGGRPQKQQMEKKSQ